ncbi:MAG: hypothetical protein LBS92_07590 [Candidatus Methanoplasma sp.]|nr:hypothetical protein [Candidatus Methanoplasma sp.]
MAGRRCPECGERLGSDSLTCPKCYAEVPREPSVQRPKRGEGRPKRKFAGVVVLLAIIPAFFGVLGLGQIFRNPRGKRGYCFLVAGLAVFVPFAALFVIMLNSGLLSAIFLFLADAVLFVIYLSAALAALLDAMFGSVFKALKF